MQYIGTDIAVLQFAETGRCRSCWIWWKNKGEIRRQKKKKILDGRCSPWTLKDKYTFYHENLYFYPRFEYHFSYKAILRSLLVTFFVNSLQKIEGELKNEDRDK